jgi:hypothetical protein
LCVRERERENVCKKQEHFRENDLSIRVLKAFVSDFIWARERERERERERGRVRRKDAMGPFHVNERV